MKNISMWCAQTQTQHILQHYFFVRTISRGRLVPNILHIIVISLKRLVNHAFLRAERRVGLRATDACGTMNQKHEKAKTNFDVMRWNANTPHIPALHTSDFSIGSVCESSAACVCPKLPPRVVHGCLSVMVSPVPPFLPCGLDVIRHLGICE